MTYLAFSPDGQFLAKASDDGTVQLWRTTDGAQQDTLIGPSAPVTGIIFSPDGELLAAASSNVIRLWRIPSGERGDKLADHSDTVTQIAFSPDGHILASSPHVPQNPPPTVSHRDPKIGSPQISPTSRQYINYPYNPRNFLPPRTGQKSAHLPPKATVPPMTADPSIRTDQTRGPHP